MFREDFRKDHQPRSISVESNVCTEANGSVRYKLQSSDGSDNAQTEVLVAVQGPGQPRTSKNEDIKHVTIAVNFRFCESSGDNDRREKELGRQLRKVCESCIQTEQYARLALIVSVSVLHNGGSVGSAAIMGTVLALREAGIQLRWEAVAATVVITKAEENAQERMLLDPLREEEESAAAVVEAAFVFDRETGDSKVNSLIVLGNISQHTLDDALALIRDHCKEMHQSS